MSMWEIDTLLTNSIELIKKSGLDNASKKQIIWNLEHIPDVYEFDAGNFSKTELDHDFNYNEINPFELGVQVVIEAQKNNTDSLIYDWSAFLLNNWTEYFSKTGKLEDIKSKYLEEMKAVFSKLNFKDYEPLHATLTIYENGNKWFSEEQNNLIKWYCS